MRHFFLAWALAGLSLQCDPYAPARVANVATTAAYASELTGCRQQGAAAKSDGGDGLAVYQACACVVDAKYGLDAGGCQ